MKRTALRSCAAVVIAALSLTAGCDDGGPDGPDLIGRWRVTALEDGTGDLTAVVHQAFHVIRFEFAPDGSFRWFQDGVDDRDDDLITGAYALDPDGPDAGTVRLTLEDDGFAVQLDFDLTVLTADRIRLATRADRFNEISEADFSGTLIVTLDRL
ncbi:MAG: hypothetical protein R3247_00875 [Rhodothermales bacterium]|nr:hypothetical protein [Rhodothermales bacterium]